MYLEGLMVGVGVPPTEREEREGKQQESGRQVRWMMEELSSRVEAVQPC